MKLMLFLLPGILIYSLLFMGWADHPRKFLFYKINCIFILDFERQAKLNLNQFLLPKFVEGQFIEELPFCAPIVRLVSFLDLFWQGLEVYLLSF